MLVGKNLVSSNFEPSYRLVVSSSPPRRKIVRKKISTSAMEEESPQRAEAHIAMLSTPGLGHLIPLMEFARKLHSLHSSISITFVIPNDVASSMEAQKARLSAFPAVNSIFLPPAGGEDLPENATLEERIIAGVTRSIPSLRTVLTQLNESTPLSAFVFDFFGSYTLDMVKELGIPAYIFSPSAATTLCLNLYQPELDASCDCEFRDLPQPINFPGGVPVHSSDLGERMQDRKSKAYKSVLDMCRKYSLADGIIVNSFVDLEMNAFKMFDENHDRHIPPAYAIGPLVRTGSKTDIGGKQAECLNWLDHQPTESVLFVSFGSGGTLSSDQLTQLALGLEASEQRFVLVARKPNDGSKSAAYFGAAGETDPDPFDYLPSGFLERTKDKGFVLPEWAPQIEILQHKAVGGFLTHCGWNSTLESIVHGVPLIALPLFAEQRLNAVLLSESLKVALRVRENENGVVPSAEIARLVRKLIEGKEGEEMGERMRNLKAAAEKAIGADGSSTQALASLAQKWTRGI